MASQNELFASGELGLSGGGHRVAVEPGHLNFGFGRSGTMRPLPLIDGMYYISAFLDALAEQNAIRMVDSNTQAWLGDLQRRVQHFGWRYDYRARSLSAEMRIGRLPGWIQIMAQRVFDETGLFDRVPDQVIVNEYEPGQGIALHTDRPCFGPSVASVSLGDAWEMEFRPRRDRRASVHRIMLERGSAIILSGVARAHWMHGIARRRTEGHGAEKRDRRRRLSLTFRTVEEGGT